MDRDQEKKIYSKVIDSDTYEVCKEVRTILDRLQLTSGIDSDQCFDIKVILCELLQNAIKHGNDCDTRKKIHLDVWLQENSEVLGITVIDQGCGFNPINTMELRQTRLPECDPISMDESGRGLMIVQNLCDCMEFNTMGNSITIKKRL